MPGSYGEPYRPPCGGWNSGGPKTYLATCGNHRVSAHKAVPRLRNTTVVPAACVECDNCEGAPPPPAPPSPRSVCGVGETNCDPSPCGPWPEPVPQNTYTPDGTVDLSECRKLGFKNVYGAKNWHGVFGRKSHHNGRRVLTMNGNGDCAQYEGVRSTPDTTKYRSMSVLITYSETSDTPSGSNARSFTLQTTCTIDRYSGKATGSRSYSESDTNPGGWGTSFATILTELMGYVGLNQFDIPGLYNSWKFGYVGVGLTETYVDGATPSAEFNGTASGYTHDVSFHANFAAASLSGTYDTTDASPSHTVQSRELNITDTGLTYNDTIDTTATIGPDTYVSATAKNVSVTYSDPYTAAELEADVNEIMAEWDLGDDAQYPWRTDGDIHSGPLMTRNERAPTAPFLWPEDVSPGVPWTDETLPPRPSFPDGGIIGAPLPAGSDAFFDFYHVTYEPEAVLTGIAMNPATYGAWSPYPHATQWTDNAWGLYASGHTPWLPAGPFISLNSLFNPEKFGTCGEPIGLNPNTLWKCKWAEVIMGSRPSVNFFRPCGDDRNEADPATVNCGTNPDGDPRWPTADGICGRIRVTAAVQNGGNVDITVESATTLATGDLVDFTGVAGLGSGLSVTVTDSTHFSVLGTLSGSYSGGGYVQCNGSPHYAWNDDQRKGQFVFKEFIFNFRDFWESYHQREIAAASVQYNIDNDPDCPVISPVSPVRYLAVTPDDPDEFFNEIGTGSWWLETQTTTQKCTQFSPCSPSVFIVSDNTETTRQNSQQVAIPRHTTQPLDALWGTMWMGRVEQWMGDPFWLAPGADYISLLCNLSCTTLAEDTGAGLSDGTPSGTCYYPMRPWVEALASLPQRTGGETAPDPASNDGAVIGCANYIANLNADPQVVGPSACAPHYTYTLTWDDSECGTTAHFYRQFGEANDFQAPWVIQLLQEATVAASGRFSAEYQANWVRG